DKSMSDDDRLDHRLNDIQRLVYKRQAYIHVGNKELIAPRTNQRAAHLAFMLRYRLFMGNTTQHRLCLA
uniref:hypothetical protein n=1 Tax=Pseudoalteromonas aliena TaxID=247523 RepID=UPI0024953457